MKTRVGLLAMLLALSLAAVATPISDKGENVVTDIPAPWSASVGSDGAIDAYHGDQMQGFTILYMPTNHVPAYDQMTDVRRAAAAQTISKNSVDVTSTTEAKIGGRSCLRIDGTSTQNGKAFQMVWIFVPTLSGKGTYMGAGFGYAGANFTEAEQALVAALQASQFKH